MPALKNFWKGGAAAVAQVDTFTPGGTIEADDVFTITLTDEKGNDHALTAVAGGTSVNDVCESLLSAYEESTDSEWSQVTMEGVGSPGSYTAVTLTANLPGRPFYATAETTESGGGAADAQTFSHTLTLLNSGPYDWNTSANWSLFAAPADEDVYFEDGSYSVYYGLDQSAITVASLNIAQSYTGYIGTEDCPLSIGASILRIGYPLGTGEHGGSGRININLGSVSSAISIFNSSTSSSDAGLPPIRLNGTSSSNTLVMYRGVVGLACEWSTSQFTATSITVHYMTAPATDCYLYLGPGVTVTTLTSYGGIITLNNTATITTLNAHGGALDFTQSQTPRTVTTLNSTPTGRTNAVIKYDPSVVTFTNKIAPASARVAVTIERL